MAKRRLRRGGHAALLAVMLLMAAPFGVAALAQESAPAPSKFSPDTDNPFSALVGKRRSPKKERGRGRGAVERYVLTSDDRTFLFEERGGVARVQFLCAPDDLRIDCVIDEAGPSPEIHQLTATRAPRGDIIYKSDEGEMLLRIAAYGGATVFWPGETQGIAASKSFGDDRPLNLPPAGYDLAVSRAQSAAGHLSAETGSPIYFDINAGGKATARAAADEAGGSLARPSAANRRAADAAVLADAVLTAAKGMSLVADDPTGARIIGARIKRVAFLPAPGPDVTLNGAVLEIRYAPTQGITGRPSSSLIAQYLEETL